MTGLKARSRDVSAVMTLLFGPDNRGVDSISRPGVSCSNQWH